MITLRWKLWWFNLIKTFFNRDFPCSYFQSGIRRWWSTFVIARCGDDRQLFHPAQSRRRKTKLWHSALWFLNIPVIPGSSHINPIYIPYKSHTNEPKTALWARIQIWDSPLCLLELTAVLHGMHFNDWECWCVTGRSWQIGPLRPLVARSSALRVSSPWVANITGGEFLGKN